MTAGELARILIVDDDPAIRASLREMLSCEGFVVHEAADEATALDLIRREPIDIVTLDLRLGNENGLDACRSIKSLSAVPVVIVTSKGTDIDRIIGLEVGADDYVAKPFNYRVLLARLKAVLRRTKAHTRQKQDAPHFRVGFGSLTLDMHTRQLESARGDAISLTRAEFDLLSVFARNPDRVLTRDVLLQILSGDNADSFDRAIDTLVGRLRKKIEDDPAHPKYIRTIRGVGYVFRPGPGA